MRFGGSGACSTLVALAALVATVAVGRDAGAVGTRTFELDSIEKLSGGDLKGASVGSDGVVRAGWMLSNAPLPAGLATASAAVAQNDGSVLVATGTGRKVIRFVGDQASEFAETKEDILALAISPKGEVVAGTDSANIYRLSQGKADLYATVPDVGSVNALAFDKSGGLWAATGSNGEVWFIDAASRAPSRSFKTDDPFVVSLAIDDAGNVYAGTSGKGLLYRRAAQPTAGQPTLTVLYDFPADEVRGIATGPKGVLYAIANESSGNTTETSESSSSRRGGGGRNPPGPVTPPRPRSGKGSLWRFDGQGRPERLMHHDDFHYMSVAVGTDGAPFVGTGAEGRVYTVDDAHVVSLVADTDDRQVTAIGVAGAQKWIVGSDPAVFHRVIGVGGAQAAWTSKSLDAGLRARFGHITWRGTGGLEVTTRSGNSQTPDASWTGWSGPVQQGGVVSSPAARYVQVRAALTNASATIADVTLAFVTENLRAVVTEVTAKPRAGLPEAKEGIVQSGSTTPKHENVVHLSWKVDNPDSDELRYRVQYRQEGQQRWADATKPDDVLTKSELDWDTTALPEGKYRLRVDASDEISNPPDETQRHTLESAPMLVDNTPPVFKSAVMQGRRLKAQVVDGLGPIVRVEVAVDGRVEWRPLGAADGIFDTADEGVDSDISSLLPAGGGPHLVTVRAYDAAGNSAVREIEAP